MQAAVRHASVLELPAQVQGQPHFLLKHRLNHTHVLHTRMHDNFSSELIVTVAVLYLAPSDAAIQKHTSQTLPIVHQGVVAEELPAVLTQQSFAAVMSHCMPSTCEGNRHGVIVVVFNIGTAEQMQSYLAQLLTLIGMELLPGLPLN